MCVCVLVSVCAYVNYCLLLGDWWDAIANIQSSDPLFAHGQQSPTKAMRWKFLTDDESHLMETFFTCSVRSGVTVMSI